MDTNLTLIRHDEDENDSDEYTTTTSDDENGKNENRNHRRIRDKRRAKFDVIMRPLKRNKIPVKAFYYFVGNTKYKQKAITFSVISYCQLVLDLLATIQTTNIDDNNIMLLAYAIKIICEFNGIYVDCTEIVFLNADVVLPAITVQLKANNEVIVIMNKLVWDKFLLSKSIDQCPTFINHMLFDTSNIITPSQFCIDMNPRALQKILKLFVLGDYCASKVMQLFTHMSDDERHGRLCGHTLLSYLTITMSKEYLNDRSISLL